MGLRHHLHLLYRQLWLIALATALGGAAAAGVSARLPRTYAASTTLMIYQAPASNGAADYSDLLTSARMVRTFSEAIHTYPVLRAVIDELGLADSPQTLARRVEVQTVRDTQLIVLTVEDADPQRAADIANALGRAFIRQSLALNASLYAEPRRRLEAELAAIQADIEAVQQRLDQPGAARSLAGQVEYDRLRMLLWEYRSVQATISHRLENVRAAEAQTSNLIHIIEPALPAAAPVSPRPLLYMALGALLGGFLAVLGVTLRDYLDTTVRGAHTLGQLIGQPVLTTVPGPRGRGGAARLVLASGGEDPAAEAYSVLRTRLMAGPGQPPRTLLVTSARAGEGKTTTALNLAAALAQGGQRVILVDADLRRPTLHTCFQLNGERGLTAWLRGEQAVEDAGLLPTAVERLRLLPAGPAAASSARLLLSSRMAALLAALAADADVVVLDGPALLETAGTSLLAGQVDGTLLVVRSGATPAADITQAAALLAQDGAHLLGAVLNLAPGRRAMRLAGYPVRYQGERGGAQC